MVRIFAATPGKVRMLIYNDMMFAEIIKIQRFVPVFAKSWPLKIFSGSSRSGEIISHQVLSSKNNIKIWKVIELNGKNIAMHINLRNVCSWR